jgi:hypothetical protein
MFYAIEAWFNAPNYLTDKVVVLQKKAIRSVKGLQYNAHTEFHFTELKILKVEQ